VKGFLRLGWLVLFVGCAHPTPVAVPAHPAHTVVLKPTAELGRSFMAQQRLTGRYGDKEFAMDVVLQLAGGKLTLIGLTPFGTRAFVLEQQGTEVKLEKFIDREVPVDPRYVLDDIHRVFFRSLAEANPDGSTTREESGEQVSELRSGGVLKERRFRRLDGKPAGELVVTFEGPPAPVVAPHVTLVNGWFGYTLRVDTLQQQYL
jgi:hypothetical protein